MQLAAWYRGTAAVENINGSASSDTLDGKGGNDNLYGSGGGDTYIYAAGYGNDSVYEETSDGTTDVVKLIWLNQSDVTFSRSGNHLLIQINSSGEVLRVDSHFDGTSGIEQVVFADNTVWDRSQIATDSMDRGTAIALAAVVMDLPDLGKEREIGGCTCAHRALGPSIIAGRRELDTAHINRTG